MWVWGRKGTEDVAKGDYNKNLFVFQVVALLFIYFGGTYEPALTCRTLQCKHDLSCNQSFFATGTQKYFSHLGYLQIYTTVFSCLRSTVIIFPVVDSQK